MISLHNLLAFGWKSLPLIVAIAFAVILVIAFIIGAVKGSAKVSYNGLCWTLAGALFLVLYKLLGKKDPFNNGYLWALLLVIGCVVVALLLTWLIKTLFSKKKKLVKNYEMDENGLEYEADDLDDTPVGALPSDEQLVVKGKAKPSVASRIFGGIFTMLNEGLILGILTAVFVLVVGCTSLQTKAIGQVFETAIGRFSLKVATGYVLDFLAVGLMLVFAYQGYKSGFIAVFSGILKALTFIVVIGGLAVPFIGPVASKYVFRVLIERCTALFGKLNPTICAIAGKLLAGILMAIIGSIIVALLTLAFDKLSEKIEDSEATVIQVINGIFGVILNMAIGALAITGICGLLYVFDYCGILYTSKLFSEKASLIKECFLAGERFLKGFLDRYILRFQA